MSNPSDTQDNPTRLRLVEEIFHEALEQPPDSRAAFVKRRCGTDPELLRQVERLLSADTGAEEFLAAPALGPDFVMPAPQALGDGAAPRRVGPYQLVRLLGSGGIGHVWLARRADEHFEKDVALKLIKRGMDTDAILERFRRERQVLARLEHPNIARLIDGGAAEDGLPYLVMEYVDGQPIDRYCRERGLTVNQCIGLFREVCAAVQYAHRNLVVHRDLKPGNILVVDEDRGTKEPTDQGTKTVMPLPPGPSVPPSAQPKIIDFGIAKVLRSDAPAMTVTSPEGRLLTPEYASPEQIRGQPISTASDVYSLGVVLYELLTTQMPYEDTARTPLEMERLVCESEPIRPSTVVRRAARTGPSPPRRDWPEGDPLRLSRRLHGDLDTILLTALRKEPALRYASVERLSEDLDRFVRRLPVSARAPTRLYRTRRFVQRHAAIVGLTALTALAVATGLVVSTRAYFRAEAARRAEADQRRLAEQEAARSASVIRFMETTLLKADRAEQKGNPNVTVREFLDLTSVELSAGASKLEPEAEAVIRLTLGRTYLNLSLLPQAERHFRASLELHRQTLGPEHQGVVQSLQGLGRVLRAIGNPAEAEACQREVIRICRRPDGRPSAYVAQGLNSLAILLRQQGKLDEAEAAYREALQTYREALGPDHSTVGDTLHNWGTLLNYRGEPAKAEPLLREALAIHNRTEGEDSWEVVGDRYNLAQSLYALGQQDAALAMLRQVVDDAVKLHGQEHLSTATYQVTLSGWLEELGDWTEAERLGRAALAARERLVPDGHGDVSEARGVLARVLKKLGRWEEADCVLREAGMTPPPESSDGAP